MSLNVQLVASHRWPFPIHLAGAFAEAACHVEAVTPRNHVLALSQRVSKWRWYNPLRPHQSLADAIARSAPDLVIPCDDRAVHQLLELYDMMGGEGGQAKVIEHSLGMMTSYMKLGSRSRSISIAIEEGVTAPPTQEVSNPSELGRFVAEHGLPVVLKTDGSFGGRGIVIARSLDEVKRGFERLRRPPSFLRTILRITRAKDFHLARSLISRDAPVVNAQVYAPGEPATSAIVCWRGELLAAVHFDVIKETCARGAASVVRAVARPAMQEAARRIARRFGLSGFHGLDFVYDAKRDICRLVEINPRATPTSHFAFDEARDLVSSLVATLTGEAIRRLPRPGLAAYSEPIALFPQEWLRDPQSPYISTAYCDLPAESPDLLKKCLDRTWLDRLADRRASGYEQAEASDAQGFAT